MKLVCIKKEEEVWKIMKNNVFSYKVNNESGRIDKFLSGIMSDTSRSQIQDWINDGDLTVNGELVKAKYKIQPNDEIYIEIPEPEEISTEPEDIPIEIVYQDSDVAVVNKPSGMVVHPSAGHHSGTLVNALLYHIKDLSGINGEIRPGIVHRIDKDTSGLLMVAKNDTAHQSLSDQLKEKTVLREYVALVHGEIPHDKATIDAPIGRDPKDRKKFTVIENGKDAVTNFEVLETIEDFTFVKLKLETGRTHQIRVHMNYIGFPVAGDPMYGPRKTLEGKGQFLHAKKLGFTHPTTAEEMTFDSVLPKEFEETIAYLKARE